MEQHELPALYRVHDSPRAEKLELLREYLGGLGLGLRRTSKITPADYQEVLQSIQDRPDAHLIQTVMLRSMNQAVYQPENRGHFGLAYDAYAHFTSPIRRYPDLLVHRAIRRVIRSDIKSSRVRRHPETTPINPRNIYPYSHDEMAAIGEQCSVTERRADEATRDVVSWLKCEYLQSHVGEVFEGIIASVVGFGLFVELKDLYVEGLVHITSLPQDYYRHEAAQYRLVGERTRRVFNLGDELTVRVVGVNLDERKIDFEIVEQKPRKISKPGSGKADSEDAKVPGTKRRRNRKPRKRAVSEAAQPAGVQPAAGKGKAAPAGKKATQPKSKKKKPAGPGK